MSEIPREAAAFFADYVPAQLGSLGASLGGLTSPGAVVFEVAGVGTWSLRLTNGVGSVVASAEPDALVHISCTAADFEPVIVRGAEVLAGDGATERQLMAARVLTVDADRARMLRDAPGTLALKLTGANGAVHGLVLALGGAAPKPTAPDCEISCALEDLWAIQSGKKNAFELLMEGRLAITGKIELAMALAAALG